MKSQIVTTANGDMIWLAMPILAVLMAKRTLLEIRMA